MFYCKYALESKEALNLFHLRVVDKLSLISDVCTVS